MVQAGKQCYFPLNPPKLLAGRVYADTFHSIIATIELISHLQNSNQSKVNAYKCLTKQSQKSNFTKQEFFLSPGK